MSKKFTTIFAATLCLSTVLFTSGHVYASENSTAQDQNWTAPKDDSRYWGNPTQNIGSDEDQKKLDAQTPAVPGLSVIPGKVFGFRPNSRNASTSSSGSGDLIDHRGSILPTINTHAIFWGSVFPSGYQTNVQSFLTNLNCSSCSSGLSGMIKQYTRGGNIISIGSSLPIFDNSNPPTSAPTTTAIANEVVKVINANHLTLDSNGMYLVYASNFPSRASYCAFHGAATVRINGTNKTFTFGYMPNPSSQLSGCGAHYLPGYQSSGLGESTDSAINVTTHELYETMTDPMTSGNAWYDATGYEIGDKCAWNWSTTIVQGSITFYVQQEYSNTAHACQGA
jgi:hypothetical protein